MSVAVYANVDLESNTFATHQMFDASDYKWEAPLALDSLYEPYSESTCTTNYDEYDLGFTSPEPIFDTEIFETPFIEQRYINPVEQYLHSHYEKYGYYPKMGVFDDCASECGDLEEDIDAEGELDDGDCSSVSSSSLSSDHPPIPIVSPAEKTIPEVFIPSADEHSGAIIDLSCSDDESDDDYRDPTYDPLARRGSSLPPIPSSAPSTSSAPSSSPTRVSRSVNSTPKRKFSALESDADSPEAEGNSKGVSQEGKPYYTLYDSSGRIYYQCQVCPNFRTKASGDMRRHLESLIHSAPSYKCEWTGCGKLFTRTDALKRHVKLIHGSVGNPPPRKTKKMKLQNQSVDDA